MGDEGLSARLAAAIHEARRYKGVSQAKLASQLGVSEDTVGDWERGRVPETWINLLNLARLLLPNPSQPQVIKLSLDRLAMGDGIALADRIAAIEETLRDHDRRIGPGPSQT